LDSTKVSFHHQLLMVSLAFQRRAIPIVWTWRPFSRGHSSAPVQIALLAYVRTLLPSDVEVLVVGDSEFESGELQAQLEQWGWRYALRQKPSTLLARTEQSDWLAVRRLVRAPGQSVWVRGARLSMRHRRKVNLLAHWAPQEDEPWLLATNLPTRRATLQAYRRRVWLDEMFGDLKRHGFDLQASHLRHGVRISRLTLAVVLVYTWLVRTGEQVIKQGRRHLVDRNERRDISIFQIGLRWIERCLTNGEPFTISFAPA
jgi:hypothetical protein